MKCLSLKPPWAVLIVQGIKPVENRTWRSEYRGPLLIHASKTWDTDGAEWIVTHFPELKGMIDHSRHLRGCIIGHVKMTDCVTHYESKWFFGPYGFVFKDPYEFYREDAVVHRGQLRIFEIPGITGG